MIRLRYMAAIPILVAASFMVFAFYSANSVNAVTSEEWMAGNIIDDGVFADKASMSTEQIQSWLDSRLRNCDPNGTKPSEISGGIDYNSDGIVTRAEYGKTVGNPAPFTCLNKYYEVPKTTPSSTLPKSNYGTSVIPSGAKSAAQLIYDAAQAYDISPKVLLVKLGTESAGPLTDDTWPFKSQYTYAMGAHCPDSGPGGSANCDVNYAGFSLQMLEAAKLLRWYLDSMDESWWPYKDPYKVNYVLWNVQETGCGGDNIYLQNKATAALYTYTPYQPNSASLTSYPGTGNSCSSYGNRNFWYVYNLWFGKSRLPKVAYRVYDANSDKTGEIASIGFALEQKPKATVTIPVAVSSPSNAEIADGVTSLTFTESDWDSPAAHTIKIIGKDNINLTGTRSYTLITGKPSSNDSAYNQLLATDTPDVPLVAQTSDPAPVWRLYSSVENRHFYTSDPIEKSDYIANGWADEGTSFYSCSAGNQTLAEYIRGIDSRLAAPGSTTAQDLLNNGFNLVSTKFSASSAGSIPVYRLSDAVNQRTLYSTNPNEGISIGFINKGVVFNACASDDTAVYRLNKPGGSHFYTSSVRERDKAIDLGYKYEQSGYYICDQSAATVPVYRFLRTDKGIRFYTTSESEKTKALSLGYTYEGIAFKLCTDGNTDVYRLYNPSTGRRLYTTSVVERDNAIKSLGFRYEGIAYKVR